MTTEHSPFEAGVGFAVKLEKGPFRGRDALQRRGADPSRRLSCLRFDDPRVVVMGKEPVLHGGNVVGYVTSAGFGYSTGESLAYAWLPAEIARPDALVDVEYFGEPYSASVVSEPRWDPEGLRLRV